MTMLWSASDLFFRLTRVVGSVTTRPASRSRAMLVGLICALAGCAAPVLRSDVLSFHQWPAGVTDRTFALKRLAAQEGSLEHATYESILRNELVAAGFRESQQARFAITLEYSVQTRVARVYDSPVLVSPSLWWSSGVYRSGWGLSVGVPFGYPYPPYSRDYPVAARTVKLFMHDQSVSGSPRVWEGTVNSSGSTADLAPVMPYLLRALLAEFPGQSGLSRRIDVELPDKR